MLTKSKLSFKILLSLALRNATLNRVSHNVDIMENKVKEFWGVLRRSSSNINCLLVQSQYWWQTTDAMQNLEKESGIQSRISDIQNDIKADKVFDLLSDVERTLNLDHCLKAFNSIKQKKKFNALLILIRRHSQGLAFKFRTILSDIFFRFLKTFW